MTDSDGLPPLRDVIAALGLSARKSLGQNYLLDLNLTGRIARSAQHLDRGTVIEIGPGPGGLTRALLANGARKVIAIERDPRFLPALAMIAQAHPGRLDVIEGDALRVDAAHLGEAPRRIVANLPYNVATPLLLNWLGAGAAFAEIVVLLQKEVAARLVAAPGGGDYGRLSIAVQWRAEAKLLFDIPPRAFTPPPKVTSTLVRLVPHAAARFPARAETLERVTAAAFGQRRKMLRQSLRSLLPDPEPLLLACGIPPTERAERVSVEGFCKLANAFDAMRGTAAV